MWIRGIPSDMEASVKNSGTKILANLFEKTVRKKLFEDSCNPSVVVESVRIDF